MLQRPLQEPGGQCLEGLAAGLAIAERGLERLAMGLTGWRAGARGGADVGLPRAWRRDKRHGGGWGTAEVGRHTAPAAHRPAVPGLAETVVGGARARPGESQ